MLVIEHLKLEDFLGEPFHEVRLSPCEESHTDSTGIIAHHLFYIEMAAQTGENEVTVFRFILGKASVFKGVKSDEKKARQMAKRTERIADRLAEFLRFEHGLTVLPGLIQQAAGKRAGSMPDVVAEWLAEEKDAAQT